MLATISKWGNGHGIRFSKDFIKEANIKASFRILRLIHIIRILDTTRKISQDFYVIIVMLIKVPLDLVEVTDCSQA